MIEFGRQLINNMLTNKSDFSYGSSIFLFFFLGLLCLLMFRWGLLTAIIHKVPLPKLKKRRKGKNVSFVSEYVNPLKRIIQWLLFCNYTNTNKYVITSKKLFTIAYCFNILYLTYLIVDFIIIVIGLFNNTFKFLSILFTYIHLYFFVFPVGTAGFVFMIKSNINKK